MSKISKGAPVRRISPAVSAQSGFLTDWKDGTFPSIDTIVKQIRPNRTDYREMRQHIRDRFAVEWTQGAENGLTLEQARKQALIWAQNRADSMNSSFAPLKLIRSLQASLKGGRA